MDHETDEWMNVDIEDTQDVVLIHASGHGYVYQYKDHFAIKWNCWRRELEIMKLVDDCSITPRGKVFHDDKVVGIIMDLCEPIVVSSLNTSSRKRL